MADKQHFAEYKFKGGNFTKDGHAMFTEDVVRDLNRKSHLEEQRLIYLQAFGDIVNMCVGEIAMSVKLDADAVGRLIFAATGLNAEEFRTINRREV